ncbi:MAG: hypothetical protein CMH83_19485 [Nocardioides sp.]|nr:hypothetical protein [Nocardioides sp.]
MARREDGTHTSLATEHPADHQTARSAWAPIVATGTVECRRGPACRAPALLIAPDDEWDLGDPDAACDAPRAPEHRQCNRATATWRRAAGRRTPELHPAHR